MTPDVGLANWFRQRALRSPERIALRFEGRDWTYAQMQSAIEDCATQLAAFAVARGERVAFLGLNQPLFFFAMFASARLGTVFVPLNTRLTGPELGYMLEDCGASVLIVDAHLRAAIELQRCRLPALRAILATEDTARWTTGGAMASEAVAARDDDVALIMYTSGTTGRQKGAMLTHGNLWWNNINCIHALDILADDVTLTAAPVFHIAGLNVMTLMTLQKGGLVVLHRNFDAYRVLADISKQKVTTILGLPAMFQFMAQHPAFGETDLSSLRMLVVGGAPCPASVLKAYLSRGLAMLQGYGLTEAAPLVTFLAPEFALEKLGSSGKPPLFVEVKIVDAGGRSIATADTPGEILVRGPNVTPGYWRRPDETSQTIDEDGWLRTGDAGFFDEQGFLFVSDRIKDMIITGGENVYPAEVEDVLMRHPAIAEVAVIGEPNEQWGEGVVAIAALKSAQTLTIDELREFAGACLARYKLPRRLEIVSALPRNATGKTLKYLLRQAYATSQAAPPGGSGVRVEHG